MEQHSELLEVFKNYQEFITLITGTGLVSVIVFIFRYRKKVEHKNYALLTEHILSESSAYKNYPNVIMQSIPMLRGVSREDMEGIISGKPEVYYNDLFYFFELLGHKKIDKKGTLTRCGKVHLGVICVMYLLFFLVFGGVIYLFIFNNETFMSIVSEPIKNYPYISITLFISALLIFAFAFVNFFKSLVFFGRYIWKVIKDKWKVIKDKWKAIKDKIKIFNHSDKNKTSSTTKHKKNI